jgi:DNA-binding IscR family transcriptional regulator
MVECFRADGGGCVLTPRCRLKGRLKRAADAFLSELDKTSLAECAYPGPAPDGRSKALPDQLRMGAAKPASNGEPEPRQGPNTWTT